MVSGSHRLHKLLDLHKQEPRLLDLHMEEIRSRCLNQRGSAGCLTYISRNQGLGVWITQAPQVA